MTDFLYGFLLGILATVIAMWILSGNNKPDEPKEQSVPNFIHVDAPYPSCYRLADLSDNKLVTVCQLVLRDALTLENCKKNKIGRRKWEKIKRTWLASGLLESRTNGTVFTPTGTRRTVVQIMEQANKRVQQGNSR